jgi:hypothetical protein
MRRRTCRKWMTGAAVFIAGLAAPGLVFAQGCAMCYNSAAAANAGAIQALRSGILVLLIPPVLIFGAICTFALRNRSRFNDGNAVDDNSQSFSGQLPRIAVAAGASPMLGKSDQDEHFAPCPKEWL